MGWGTFISFTPVPLHHVEREESNVLPAGLEVVAVAAISGSDHPRPGGAVWVAAGGVQAHALRSRFRTDRHRGQGEPLGDTPPQSNSNVSRLCWPLPEQGVRAPIDPATTPGFLCAGGSVAMRLLGRGDPLRAMSSSVRRCKDLHHRVVRAPSRHGRAGQYMPTPPGQTTPTCDSRFKQSFAPPGRPRSA